MSADMSKSCLEGGKKHLVNATALAEARTHPSEDGSYTVVCEACGKTITKGPTDLTDTAGGGVAA